MDFNQYEYDQQENMQRNMPGRYMVSDVISVKEWLITLLVLSVPCVGIIMMFVWAFGGGSNINKSNFCKAQLIMAAIMVVLVILFYVVIGVATYSMVTDAIRMNL